MKNFERQNFIYTSVGGKTSERDAFIFSLPSDSFFGYELSEFDEVEAAAYAEALRDIYKDVEESMYEAIDELGLKHNFRRFKADGVNNEK